MATWTGLKKGCFVCILSHLWAGFFLQKLLSQTTVKNSKQHCLDFSDQMRTGIFSRWHQQDKPPRTTTITLSYNVVHYLNWEEGFELLSFSSGKWDFKTIILAWVAEETSNNFLTVVFEWIQGERETERDRQRERDRERERERESERESESERDSVWVVI